MPTPPRYALQATLQAQYERALARWLSQLSGELWRALEPHVTPARMDASSLEPVPPNLSAALALLKRLAPSLLDLDASRALLLRLALNSASIHRDAMTRQLTLALKPRLRKNVERIDLFGLEPWLRPEAERWAAANASLITQMPLELIQKATALTQQATPGGLRHEELAKKLQEALSVPPSRARLIARDQMAKWNGSLTLRRFAGLGIDRYRWRTARDRRVVGTPGGAYPEASDPSKHGDHFAREGRIFLVGRVPLVEVMADGKQTTRPEMNDGPPGHGIQCRCWAEPVIDELEDLIDQTPSPIEMGGG